MKCFHPIYVRGGYVPCGKCPACLANRQKQWTFRLEAEKQACSFFFWLTLTYDDDHLPKSDDGRAKVYKPDCRAFFEKIRKRFPYVKFKHFLVSEYGPDTIRPHYHTILFCTIRDFHPMSDLVSFNLLEEQNKIRSFLTSPEGAWPNGFCYDKPFHNRVFGYVSKYCCKPELLGIDVPEKVFTMISQGIGISYLEKVDKGRMSLTGDFRVPSKRGFIQLPRYYQDKLFPRKVDFQNMDTDSIEFKNRNIAFHNQHVAASQQLASYEHKRKVFEETHKGEDYSDYIRSCNAAATDRFINKLKQRQDA